VVFVCTSMSDIEDCLFPTQFIYVFTRNVTVNINLSHHTTLTDFIFCGAATQRGSRPPHFFRFLDHTQRRTTVGRTPLDEWSARPRDLYLTAHDTHNRQTSMSRVEFEPTISAGERPQNYALDGAATGTGTIIRLPFTKLTKSVQWGTKWIF